MTPPHLHIIGIDPGASTGWARLTVPRASLYGNVPGKILEWDYGVFFGPENQQVIELCRLARGTQSLDYKIGPALVVEDFDYESQVRDKELLSPVRIAAKLDYAVSRGEADDARMILQSRGQAKSTVTDDRLRRWGFWVKGPDHIRDGFKHALTALRRAKASREFRDLLWYDGVSRPRKPEAEVTGVQFRNQNWAL